MGAASVMTGLMPLAGQGGGVGRGKEIENDDDEGDEEQGRPAAVVPVWVGSYTLLLLDAENAVAQAESDVRMAGLDAVIPASTIPLLDYERYQLTLQSAQKALVRAQADLLNRQAELRDVQAETELEIKKAEALYKRISDALDSTEMRAEKPGFVLYGENPWTGRKVFPGETLYSSFHIASVASHEDLQLRFWVHEADFLSLQLGQPVRVTPDAQGASPFMAEISTINPIVPIASPPESPPIQTWNIL